jgi:hypothetical protein
MENQVTSKSLCRSNKLPGAICHNTIQNFDTHRRENSVSLSSRRHNWKEPMFSVQRVVRNWSLRLLLPVWVPGSSVHQHSISWNGAVCGPPTNYARPVTIISKPPIRLMQLTQNEASIGAYCSGSCEEWTSLNNTSPGNWSSALAFRV